MDQFPRFPSYPLFGQAQDHQHQPDVRATVPPPEQAALTVQPYELANANAAHGQFLSAPIARDPGWAATLSQPPLLNAGAKRDAPDSGFDPHAASDHKRARTAEYATQLPVPPQPMPPFQPTMVLPQNNASYWQPAGYSVHSVHTVQVVICTQVAMFTANPLIPPSAMHADAQRPTGEDTAEGLRTAVGEDFRAREIENSYDDYEPPELVAAVESEDIERVRTLLADPNVDVNATDHVRRSALHHATEAYALAIVRMLLARPDIDVNLKNINGNTALIQAAMLEGWQGEAWDPVQQREDLPAKENAAVNAISTESTAVRGKHYPEDFEAIVLALLAAPGLDINADNSDIRDEPGFNALMTIAGLAHRELSRPLLPVLAMPNIDINATVDSDTALILAARYGNDTLIRMLLAMPGIDINVSNKHGRTALMEARESIGKKRYSDPATYRRAIEMLENHGVPTPAMALDVRDLLHAIFAPHHGASQQASSNSSATSDAILSDESAKWLDDVCARLQFGECRTPEVPLLLASIAPLPAWTKSAFARALAFGVCTGHFRKADGTLDEKIAEVIATAGLRQVFDDTFEKLQLASRNIDLYRVDDMNLLGIAASEGNMRMIRGLAKLGAWVNLPSPNGKTALAIAVEREQWDACIQLVCDGALPTLPLHDGYPAIYHIGNAFCADAHANPSLARLMHCLQEKNVPFDIRIKNPDASARREHPTVMLDELLETKLRS